MVYSLRPGSHGLSCELVAQLVEQRTFNPWVVGSSPTELNASKFAILGQKRRYFVT